MEYAAVFLTGAAGYSLLEVIWRGYTHWTMSITGGICLLLIYFMNRSLDTGIWSKCLLGAALITSAELIVGVTVNIILGWNVWDYSDIPLNFMGQICLPYSVLWYFLCLPVVWGCSLLAKIF